METEKNEPLVVPIVSLQMKFADLYVQTEKIVVRNSRISAFSSVG